MDHYFLQSGRTKNLQPYNTYRMFANKRVSKEMQITDLQTLFAENYYLIFNEDHLFQHAYLQRTILIL